MRSDVMGGDTQMVKRRGNIRDGLPSSDRTQELVIDKSGFLPDSGRMRKRIEKIYDNSLRSYRKGWVDPQVIVVKTAKRMGVIPSENPETYTLILMVIGVMSAYLLARLTRERNRLLLYFWQLREEGRWVPGLQPPVEPWLCIPDLRNRRRSGRLRRRDLMTEFVHSKFPHQKDVQKPENPLFPTFHEVMTSMAVRDFRCLGTNALLVSRAEKVYEYLRSEFDKSGVVMDFFTVKTERALVLSSDPYAYAISWLCWYTTDALQKRIADEMKPLAEAAIGCT